MDTYTNDSTSTTANPNELMDELEMLRKMVAREDAKCLHLEKEKENITMNSLFEREALLRQMASLQEQNKRLEDKSTTLHAYLFGDKGVMQSKIQAYERSLQQNEGPVIAQVHSYKPIIDRVESNKVNATTKIVDKGK